MGVSGLILEWVLHDFRAGTPPSGKPEVGISALPELPHRVSHGLISLYMKFGKDLRCWQFARTPDLNIVISTINQYARKIFINKEPIPILEMKDMKLNGEDALYILQMDFHAYVILHFPKLN